MVNAWHVDGEHVNEQNRPLVCSLKSTLAATGEEVSRGPHGYVLRIELVGQVVYIKCCWSLSDGLAAKLVSSRIKTEWRNLQFFSELGIRTPIILAYGESRAFLRYEGGALVTAEVEDAIDLEELSATMPGLLSNRDWADAVFIRIMDYTRRLHRKRFAHNDLNWRNILVNPSSREVYFFDCPRGRRWYPPFLKVRIRKDLAHLDKLAPGHLSRTQRLRYYMEYAGISKLTTRHKRDIRRIVARTNKRLERKRKAQ